MKNSLQSVFLEKKFVIATFHSRSIIRGIGKMSTMDKFFRNYLYWKSIETKVYGNNRKDRFLF